MSLHLEFIPTGFMSPRQHDCQKTYNKTWLNLKTTFTRKKTARCIHKISSVHQMYSDYVGRVGVANLVPSSGNEMHRCIAGGLIRPYSWKPMLMRFCSAYTRRRVGFSVNFALSGAARDGFHEVDSGSGGPGSYNDGGKGGGDGSNGPNDGRFGDGSASGQDFRGLDWCWCFWLVRKYLQWLSSMAFGSGYHNDNVNWDLGNFTEMISKLLEMAIFATFSPEIDLLLWFVLLAGGSVANTVTRAFNEFSCLFAVGMAMALVCVIVMSMLVLLGGYKYFRLE